MAKNKSEVNRLAVKEMVERWEGRRLPKNISMKALIDMVVDEEAQEDHQTNKSGERGSLGLPGQ